MSPSLLLTRFRRHACLLAIASLLPLAPAAANDAGKLVDHTAPACKLPARAGFDAVDLAAYRGQVVYLDFWASWCSACVRSFPFMNDLTSRYGERGFTVLAISLDENVDEAKTFLARHPANVVIAADPDADCARAFNLEAMPSSYLIDPRHVVREVHLGFRPGGTARMRESIEALLPAPPRAP